MEITITHIDTACLLIEINGYKILTDPTLDQPGQIYHHGFGAFSKKTSVPAFQKELLTDVDLILISHDQHKDNLDHSGRKFLQNAKMVVSTKPASKRISNVIGLNDWDSYLIDSKLVEGLKITAVPARHGPRYSLPIVGKVIGFILEWKNQKNGALYISGDTVIFNGLSKIAERFKIDLAIFHVGSAKFRYLTGPIRFTMNANDAVEAMHILKPRQIIPVHLDGWTHFSESQESLKNTLRSTTDTQVHFLEKGCPVKFNV